jgi:hypothetical protein
MADKVIPVKVALRIRPLVSREIGDGCTECLREIYGTPQVKILLEFINLSTDLLFDIF